jgi:prevent-host-death family protein
MASSPPVWQLHEAKARFSELFRRVRSEGPQRVVKQRGESVVIVPAEAFDRAAACEAQPASLVDFFRAAPTGRRALDLARRRDSTRTIRW